MVVAKQSSNIIIFWQWSIVKKMERRKYVCASSLVTQLLVNFNQSAQLHEKKRWFVAPGFFDLSDHRP